MSWCCTIQRRIWTDRGANLRRFERSNIKNLMLMGAPPDGRRWHRVWPTVTVAKSGKRELMKSKERNDIALPIMVKWLLFLYIYLFMGRRKWIGRRRYFFEMCWVWMCDVLLFSWKVWVFVVVFWCCLMLIKLDVLS